MRVMQIASSGGGSGAMSQCRDLCDALARRGHEVTLACEAGSWIANRVAAGVRVEFSTFRRLPLHEVRRVGAIVRDTGVEVIHTHLSAGHIFGLMLSWHTGVPIAATAHSLRLQPHWTACDRVIAVSEACAAFQRRWNLVRRSRLCTIHNFVDTARFRPGTAADVAAVRDALGLGAGPVVAICGSLSRAKRAAVALDACAAALAAHPHARVLVIGNGSPAYVERLRRRVARRGFAPRVAWAGWREDVASILPAADVLLTASRDESFSLAAAEAMACGVPVVAPPGPAQRELIGTAGVIARNAGAGALGEALIALLGAADVRQRLGRMARTRVVERFSPDRQIAAVEAALLDTVDAARTTAAARADAPRWRAQ